MSTISSVSNPQIGYTAPTPLDSPRVSSSFSQTLAAVQAPRSWLTTPEASQTHRPNVKEFMDRSGVPFVDASELIYGVVGSNTDVRDWAAIMASSDPITAARQATGQMYGRTDITARTDATYMKASDTVAQEGNFAVRLLKDEDDQVVDQGLKLIDAQGLLLRDAGSNAQTIARNAWLFGFDTQPLAKLAAAAATVSADLGEAVQQASDDFHASAAASQMPVLVMAAAENASQLNTLASQTPSVVIEEENASLLGWTEVAIPFAEPVEAEPVITVQSDDQASSPSLEQVLQEVTANAFTQLDSATYLSSLFKA